MKLIIHYIIIKNKICCSINIINKKTIFFISMEKIIIIIINSIPIQATIFLLRQTFNTCQTFGEIVNKKNQYWFYSTYNISTKIDFDMCWTFVGVNTPKQNKVKIILELSNLRLSANHSTKTPIHTFTTLCWSFYSSNDRWKKI